MCERMNLNIYNSVIFPIFSANTFTLNVLPSFTAIYSQSIVNTSLYTFIKENNHLGKDIGFIMIKPLI